MKTQSHYLSAFVLGLAYGLEKVHRIIPSSSPELKAFLFDFQNPKASFYLKNLLNFANQIHFTDSWISAGLKNFYENPLFEEMVIKDQAKQMFEVTKKIDSEDSFDYSIIKGDYRRSAEDVFLRSQMIFEKIIQAIYQNTSRLGPEYQHGIIFVQKSD